MTDACILMLYFSIFVGLLALTNALCATVEFLVNKANRKGKTIRNRNGERSN